jgi:hypothetical protein
MSEEELQEYLAFRAVQIELVKSNSVIESALQDYKVARIPRIANADDPLEWVRHRLLPVLCSDEAIPGDGEVMAVRVFDDSLSDEQLLALTDAVCEAYVREVAAAERLQKLEMSRQMADVRADFDRIISELSTEREQCAAIAAKSEHLAAPASESPDMSSGPDQQAADRAIAFAELADKRDWILRHEQLVSELGGKLGFLEIELKLSSRVKIISPAVIRQGATDEKSGWPVSP